ncbi:MAG: nucleotide exchange factor GrpE [Proteobacteria bacterium]|nr:MAG: nucleotide exchange factor GrpE [Pseudomonadota bacterium]
MASDDNAAENSGPERDADFSKLEEREGASGSGQSAEAGSDDQSALRKELEETKDKYLRSLAEFENYKKRALRERSDLIKYQGERVICDFLSILDNLDLALQHSEADYQKLQEGLQLIHKQFVDLLAKWEVRSESGVGQDFDPSKHDAISKVKVDDAKPGTIISELKKAFFYKDKLLRPAEVVVAAEAEPEGDIRPEQTEEGDPE